MRGRWTMSVPRCGRGIIILTVGEVPGIEKEDDGW